MWRYLRVVFLKTRGFNSNKTVSICDNVGKETNLVLFTVINIVRLIYSFLLKRMVSDQSSFDIWN